MIRFNKTESAVFLYCKFSLFLKNPFSPDYLASHYILKVHVPCMIVCEMGKGSLTVWALYAYFSDS